MKDRLRGSVGREHVGIPLDPRFLLFCVTNGNVWTCPFLPEKFQKTSKKGLTVGLPYYGQYFTLYVVASFENELTFFLLALTVERDIVSF